tara:strand:+ start:1131 stop:2552 length:1422 start_codon:yes stop_codon:yes gene_type:complete
MEINKYSFYNNDNKYLKLKINLKQLGGSQGNDVDEPEESNNDVVEELNTSVPENFNSNINFYELYSLDDPKFKIKIDDNSLKKEYSKINVIPSQDYYLHDLIKIHGKFDKIEEYNYLDYGTESGYQPIVLYAISKNKNLGLNLSIDATTMNNDVSKNNKFKKLILEENINEINLGYSVGKNFSNEKDNSDMDPLKDKKYNLITSTMSLVKHLEIIDTIKRLCQKLDSNGIMLLDFGGESTNKNLIDIFKINRLKDINRNYTLKHTFGLNTNDFLKVENTNIIIIKSESRLNSFYDSNYSIFNDSNTIYSDNEDDEKKEIIESYNELNSIKLDLLNTIYLESTDDEFKKIFDDLKAEILKLNNNKEKNDYDNLKTNINNCIKFKKDLEEIITLRSKINLELIDEEEILKKYVEEEVDGEEETDGEVDREEVDGEGDEKVDGEEEVEVDGEVDEEVDGEVDEEVNEEVNEEEENN